MTERKRIWIGITAALFAGSAVDARQDAAEAGHLALNDAESSSQLAARHDAGEDERNSPAEGEGEGGGEGGGEGEGEGEGASAPADLSASDVAFLARLGLIRGHLWAGHALYTEGLTEMAETHMKHPRDELYAGLVPAIRARGASPFDEALAALAEAVESGADRTQVDGAWQAVDQAIRQIETSLETTTAPRLKAIAGIVTSAADEYAIGVVGGKIDNVHEYQDAWGFVQVAIQRLNDLTGANDAETEAIGKARRALSESQELWPELAPGGRVDGNASYLYGAAARIELAAGSI